MSDTTLRHRSPSGRFVSMPPPDAVPGSVWLEAARDGVVAFGRDTRFARCLGRVRRSIAAGDMVRHHAHGQPYWTGTN